MLSINMCVYVVSNFGILLPNDVNYSTLITMVHLMDSLLSVDIPKPHFCLFLPSRRWVWNSIFWYICFKTL